MTNPVVVFPVGWSSDETVLPIDENLETNEHVYAVLKLGNKERARWGYMTSLVSEIQEQYKTIAHLVELDAPVVWIRSPFICESPTEFKEFPQSATGVLDDFPASELQVWADNIVVAALSEDGTLAIESLAYCLI